MLRRAGDAALPIRNRFPTRLRDWLLHVLKLVSGWHRRRMAQQPPHAGEPVGEGGDSSSEVDNGVPGNLQQAPSFDLDAAGETQVLPTVVGSWESRKPCEAGFVWAATLGFHPQWCEEATGYSNLSN
jgi:hypothetical protein